MGKGIALVQPNEINPERSSDKWLIESPIILLSILCKGAAVTLSWCSRGLSPVELSLAGHVGKR